MAATYEPIQTYTVSGSSTTTVAFSSIPSTYTDLYLVSSITPATGGGSLVFTVNSDTGTNYSFTTLGGNGSSASSTRATYSRNYGLLFDWSVGMPTTSISISNASFMNYSNTSTYKTVISRGNNANTFTDATVSLWRSTSAINAINVFAANSSVINAGSTFTLYGIKAA